MGAQRKITTWILWIFGILLVLLLAVRIILPGIINSDKVKSRIQTIVAEQTGGELDYNKLSILLLPKPHVDIDRAHFSIPKVVNITLEELLVYPEILPLLTGNVKLTFVQAKDPDVAFHVPADKKEPVEKKKNFSPAEFKKNLAEVLAPLAENLPNLRGKIINGRLALIETGRPELIFEKINGNILLPPKGFDFDLRCTSSLWAGLSLQGSFNPFKIKGSGELTVEQFSPEELANYLKPDERFITTESLLDINLTYKSKGLDDFQADLQTTLPHLTINLEDRETDIQGKSLKTSISIQKDLARLLINELVLTTPRISLTGEYMQQYDPGLHTLLLTGKDANIEAIHETAQVLKGWETPLMDIIFDILTSGEVPRISFQTQGKTLKELGKLENMHIKGSLQQGRITVPGINLDLEEVNGEVEIVDTILSGTGVEAKLGNSFGSQGQFKLGLIGEDIPFHLDVMVDADLSELPAILDKVIDNKAALEYFHQVTNLQGKALARLVLGESLKTIKPEIDVTEVSLTGDYKLIPYPIEISQGRVSYKNDQLSLFDMNGRLGNSSFTEYTSTITLDETPELEVGSGRLNIHLEEIYSWLSSKEELQEDVSVVKSLTGMADLTITRLAGPALEPLNWDIEGRCDLRDVSVLTSYFPEMISITKGSFRHIPDKITLESVETNFMDSTITVSGDLTDYMSENPQAELVVKGQLGPDIIQMLEEKADMPEEFYIRPPLIISGVQVAWQKGKQVALQGDFGLSGGPDISADILVTPEDLVVKKFHIRDKESDANFKLDLKKKELGLEFTGLLHRNTVDSILLSKDNYPDGWLKGDFKVHLFTEQWEKTTASGKLDGGNFIIPLLFEKPLFLEKLSLTADKRAISFVDSKLLIDDRSFLLDGNMDLSSNVLKLDMNVWTNGIVWEKLSQNLSKAKKEGKENAESKDKRTWDIELQGRVNFETDYFIIDENRWEPVVAEFNFAKKNFSVNIIEAELCGFSTPGTFKKTGEELDIEFRIDKKGGELNESVKCLEGDESSERNMTGTYDLAIAVQGQGNKDNIVNSLQGNLQFSAVEGFIYQRAQLAKLLSFLDVTNIFKGKIPDLSTEGFHYDSLKVTGVMENGIMDINPAILEAPVMQIASFGTVDIPQKRVYFQVLVAPLQTLNKIMRWIPFLDKLIRGSIASIPIEVSGPFDNIQVRPLSIAAISTRLFGIMFNVLETPVKAVEATPAETGEKSE
jgi:hypothetical protein